MSLYSDAVLAKGPGAYWRLGDPSGNAVDLSGHNVHGTYGADTVRGRAGAIANDPDTAVNWPGSSNAVSGNSGFSFPNHTAVIPGAAGWTVEAWVKFTSTAASRGIALKGSLSDYAYYVALDGNGQFVVRTQNQDGTALSISTEATAAFPSNDGAWHHLVTTGEVDGGNIRCRIYLDGVHIVTGTRAGTGFNQTTAAGTIGRLAGGYGFPGDMDEVAIYPRPLSSAEVTENYNAGRGIAPVAPTPQPGPTTEARSRTVIQSSFGRDRAAPGSGEYDLVFHKAPPVAQHTARRAAAVNLMLTGASETVDGYVPEPGDVVLALAQSNAAENGPWVVSNGAWSRPTDANTAAKMNAACVYVADGTYAGSKWVNRFSSEATLGVDSITWRRVDRKPPLIFAHGHSASVRAMWFEPSFRRLWEALAEDYVVGVSDLGYPAPGGSGWDRWGNAFARNRVDQLRAMLRNQFGAAGRVGFVGVSQGGGLALNWAYENGWQQCAFVAGIVPLIHVGNLRQYANGTYKAEIDRAYSNPYVEAKDGPKNNPYNYRALYDDSRIPTEFWTASNDDVTLGVHSGAFAAANPTIVVHDVGALGHTNAAVAAAAPSVVEFCQRMRVNQYPDGGI